MPTVGVDLGLDDVRTAQERIAGRARRTPLLAAGELSRRVGARTVLKAENLQLTGSFKVRGAFNRLAQLSDAERAAGVVAASAGNHAQGLAFAARELGIKATAVMPAGAPLSKIAAVKQYGAEVVLAEGSYDDAKHTADQLARDEGMTIVHAFDHPQVVAGQGTVGLEIAEDAAAMGIHVDAVVTPCGGGGLMAGIATAIKALSPETEMWGAEPEDFDDTRRSLAAGSRVGADPAGTSICDALMSPMPGELTFAINRKLAAGIVAVPETSVAVAMRDAAAHLKLIVEPGGAAGFAALSSGEIELAGRTIAVVLSGGNVDMDLFARLVAAI